MCVPLQLEKVLHTNLFDLEKARSSPGWLRSLLGFHVPESVEFGISSIVYRRRRPFHPGRLWELFHGDQRALISSVVRAKGTMWFAQPWGNKHSVVLNGAGKVFGWLGFWEWPLSTALPLMLCRCTTSKCRHHGMRLYRVRSGPKTVSMTILVRSL